MYYYISVQHLKMLCLFTLSAQTCVFIFVRLVLETEDRKSGKGKRMNDEVENFVSKAKNSPNEVVLWDKLSSRIVFEDFHRDKSYIFLKFFFSQVDRGIRKIGFEEFLLKNFACD